MQVEYFVVGYVLKPQGLKGEIKVKTLTDHPDRFDDLDKVFLKERDDVYRAVNIVGRRYMKESVILLLEGVVGKDQAECLRGRSLWIPRSMTKPLSKNSYFIADIIGCKVEFEEGNCIGVITDVLKTGSNDVFVVVNDKKETLIPALKKIVTTVDIDHMRIVINSDAFKELYHDED